MAFWPCLLALLVALNGASAGINQYCCLCEGCYGAKRPNFLLDANGTSCVSVDYTITTKYTPTSPQCLEAKNKYSEICCNLTYNTPWPSFTYPPSSPPVVNFPKGQFPYCDLCEGGSYPTKPYNVATIASVPGNPSCSDLYWMGRSYNIPAAICYPIKSFLAEPCGCVKPTSPPTAPTAPTPATGKPTARPTTAGGQPTLAPPTRQPTSKGTVGWFKIEKKHCSSAKLPGSWTSLSAAQAGCLQEGSKCSGVYDDSCDNKGKFFICSSAYSSFASSSSSCIWSNKLGGAAFGGLQPDQAEEADPDSGLEADSASGLSIPAITVALLALSVAAPLA